MNKLKGKVLSIKTSDDISLVEIEVDGELFYSLVLETDEGVSWLKKDCPVFVLFKETEVSIAKGLEGKISIRNRFKATVTAIEKGKLLSKIDLSFKGTKISSIITTNAADSLDIKAGDEVEALVKTNEVSLMKFEKE